jgi:hypothetical protein
MKQAHAVDTVQEDALPVFGPGSPYNGISYIRIDCQMLELEDAEGHYQILNTFFKL